MSISDLSSSLGMSHASVYQYETGAKYPNLEVAYAISKILGKNVYHIWPNQIKVRTQRIKRVVLHDAPEE